MRRSSSLTVVALAIVVLVVPGRAPSVLAADAPDGAVNAVLDAVTAHDWDAIGPLVCAAQRDAVTAALDPRRSLQGEGVDAGPVTDALTVTIEGRSVTPVDTTGDRATVQVAGLLRLVPDEAAARAWVQDSLTASGQPTDDATVDRFLGFFTAALAEGTDLAGTVDVVRQDGEWLVCDTLGGARAAVTAQAPFTSLCDVASLAELSAATGLALVRATATDGGCQWDVDPATGASSLRAVRTAVTLAAIRDLWNGGRDESVAGHPAWAGASGTWVDVDGAVLAILPTLDGTVTAAGVDPVAVALAVGALVVPRLP